MSNLRDALLPREFSLHPNYPSAFNPATTITFDLPKASHIQLVIYDLLGREFFPSMLLGIFKGRYNRSD